MQEGMCALVVRFGGSVGRVAVVFVTLCVYWGVCVRSTIAGSSVGIACGGDVKMGAPLSSGAIRLVVSLIWEGIGEGGRFGAFRLYFPLRLVGPSLLGPANLRSGEL